MAAKKKKAAKVETLASLRASTEPHSPSCMHCVLISASARFRLEHRRYGGGKALENVAQFAGEFLASMLYENPTLDSSNVTQVFSELCTGYMNSLLDKLHSVTPKH